VPGQELQLHYCTLAAAGGLTRVLRTLHLGNHELKSLLYVFIVARASFCPRALEFCCEGAAVFGGNLTLFGAEVGLVAYNNERNPFHSLVVCWLASRARRWTRLQLTR